MAVLTINSTGTTVTGNTGTGKYCSSVNLCNITIGSLNCRGLNDKAKRIELFNFLKCSKLTFIFLQETKLNPLRHNEYRKEWHNSNMVLNSIPGGRSGTALLINSPNIKIQNKIIDQSGRIITVDVDMYGNKFHLVNTYFPNEHNLKEDFICSLYPYLASNYPIIWSGDFNIALNPIIDTLRSRNGKDFCTNQLQEIIEYFALIDVCRLINPV